MIQFKHTLATIFLTVAILFQVNAQKLVLCEDHDQQGNPTGVYATWDIKAEGGYVYLLYNQTSTLESGLWYLYIDYDWDKVGTYQAYETFPIEPEGGKNWFVYDYKFKDAGSYKASVMLNGNEMATTYFTINYADGESPEEAGDVADTYYYENSTILFCNYMDTGGNPVGVASTFSMNGTGTVSVSIYLDNHGLAFKTSKMYVYVYNSDTNEKFDSFSIDVEPDWDYVKFVQTFTTPGNYLFDYYNDDDVFVNTSGVLTITE